MFCEVGFSSFSNKTWGKGDYPPGPLVPIALNVIEATSKVNYQKSTFATRRYAPNNWNMSGLRDKTYFDNELC